eukprot:CAMPEP_0184647520 /NCGR_PEP_ID=MMETSP0308-20130426/4466_1 /TAXON_ID=38269 /ORGANISM="Gloeochaete witrockiana, Strain SAG 46.84" /LENGTH=116 /DNA_ID=CAMNT_0027078549 /DNA_START=959 /DNA_END=1309 /DNA_ORIENTATION=-
MTRVYWFPQTLKPGSYGADHHKGTTSLVPKSSAGAPGCGAGKQTDVRYSVMLRVYVPMPGTRGTPPTTTFTRSPRLRVALSTPPSRPPHDNMAHVDTFLITMTEEIGEARSASLSP